MRIVLAGCSHPSYNQIVMTESNAYKIDLHISKRLRFKRSLLGMSVKTLGRDVGLSYQKLHSYEAGKSRISAGWLFELGRALNIPVTYFYEGLYAQNPLETALHELSDLPAAFFEDNFFIQPENFELLGNYHRIQDDELKSDIQKLLKTIGQNF